jgi:predicted N-formylglutamate amidohydrolase
MIEKIRNFFASTKAQKTYSQAEKVTFLMQQEFDVDEQSNILIEMRNILIADRKKQIDILTKDLAKLESM